MTFAHENNLKIANEYPDTGLQDDVKTFENKYRIEIFTHDQHIIDSIESLPEEDREKFLENALRIGIFAIYEAKGKIQKNIIGDEGEKLLKDLKTSFITYRESLNSEVQTSLKEYFDPTDGRFPQKVERLIGNNGDIEKLMRNLTEKTEGAIHNTLSPMIGPDSPIIKNLKPDEANEFIRVMKDQVNSVINEQNKNILSQFSLDMPESALNRLINELGLKNKNTAEEFHVKIENIMSEFSLDKPDSAINKLIKRVENANEQIQNEFTLDQDNSALAKLQKVLTTQIENQNKQQQEFRVFVESALSAFTARKEESNRSTTHGMEFEKRVFETFANLLDGSGDTIDDVSKNSGVISRCRTGDALITLHDDCAAPGAKIVIEAKEAEGQTMSSIREEIALARKNREAAFGIFVLSAKTLFSKKINRVQKFKQDIIVVWDSENEDSNLILEYALTFVKSFIVKTSRENDAVSIDMEVINKALVNIEKDILDLDKTLTWTNTIRNNAENIETSTVRIKKNILSQLENLNDQIERLKVNQ